MKIDLMLAFLVAGFLAFSVNAETLPDGTSRDKVTQRLWYFSPYPVIWESSAEFCKDMGYKAPTAGELGVIRYENLNPKPLLSGWKWTQETTRSANQYGYFMVGGAVNI